MISRVAESCFWLHRQLERAECMARMLGVNRLYLLDVTLSPQDLWMPVLVVSGEQGHFAGFFGPEAHTDSETVQRYLTWDERSAVSIESSLRWARENARQIREVIGLEMWESINGVWQWLSSAGTRRMFDRDRDGFYRHVRDAISMIHGVSHNTLLHDEPFDFMRLGMLMERAGQTARAIDVKHHMFGGNPPTADERPAETAQWMALLRSCSAQDPFFRRVRGTATRADIVAFLLKEPAFPRSVLHCLERAANFLTRIRERGGTGRGRLAMGRLEALAAPLASRSVSEILEQGLHDELTRLIAGAAQACDAIHAEFFEAAASSETAGRTAP